MTTTIPLNTTIKKYGNSYVVTIPTYLAKVGLIKEGDVVEGIITNEEKRKWQKA